MMFAGFLICAVAIFFSGRKLSLYGALISKFTGAGHLWIGVVLLATVTSLPELMVGIGSAAIVQSANLATGDVLGSCAFNLAILGIMDAFVPNRRSLLTIASPQHVLSAALGTILIAIAGAGIFLPEEMIVIQWIGILSPLFIILYFVSIRLVYLNEKKSATSFSNKEDPVPNISKRQAIWRFVLYSIIIVSTALMLPNFAKQIAIGTGLGDSFVGTLFLAATTSLPEIAVSYSAVRSGQINLSIGNLLGSNLFNIFVLAVDDIFYTKGFLLKDVSNVNIISVLAVVIMNAVVIIGLAYPVKNKKWLLAWNAVAVLTIYVLQLFFLYRAS